MRDDDPVIAALAAVDPHPGGADSAAGELELSRVRERIMAMPPPRLRRRRLSPGPLVAVGSALVVVVVAVLFLHAGGSSRRGSLAPTGGGSRIVLRLEPSSAHPRITAVAAREEVALLRAGVRSLGSVGITVRRLGADEIAVTVPSSESAAAVTRSLTTPPQLTFTDWEANVVAPDGRTVASQSLDRDAAAKLLSQGAGRGPGSPNAGAVALQRAVALAARRPAQPNAATLSRRGSEWFAFARTGTGGCHAVTPSCYRAGPAASRRALRVRSGDRVLAVPQGTVVVQATSPTGAGADYGDPAARFFVLRDEVALTAAQVTGARVSTSDGHNAVDLDLTERGARALQALTAAVARRGTRLGPGVGFQHFAVVSDGSLLSVLYVNDRTSPDGIIADRTGEIVGGFSPAAARRIAAELRLGALPLNLRVVSRGSLGSAATCRTPQSSGACTLDR